MAKRQIVKVGNDVLRSVSRDVTEFNEKLHVLLDDMAETMYHADGVGLAAPQIGILRNVVVIDIGDGLIEMVNPKIIEQSGSQIGQEGCLSVPGRQGYVDRPNKLKLEYQDRFGKTHKINAKEFFARAICHETDHLKGVLYIDKIVEVED